MVIFKLEQETWSGRMYSDFDLPRIIGHYETEEKAAIARLADQCRHTSQDYYTVEEDYRITPIEVI